MENRQESHQLMKKVFDIVPYTYLPYHSGGQKSIAQFLDYLAEEVDLTVMGVEDNDFSLVKYKSVPLLKKTRSRYFNIGLVSKITKLVKKEKPDIIIWEHPYFAWLAFWVRRKTGVKTILHTHNIEYQRFQTFGKWWWPILRNYERWSFRKADVLFFISPEDRQFAISEWKINADKCVTIPFGVPTKEFPADKSEARQKVAQLHSIKDDEKILLFNGVLDYKPNLDALKAIVDEINPLLMAATAFKYKIIICGKHLPADMDSLKAYADKNIIFAGFVADIEMYFKAADIFINPVQSGGGIKTKMVESIAFGTTVVATETGAVGINRNVCGEKLFVVPDNDWKAVADLIVKQAGVKSTTPPSYYQEYYWGNIIRKLLAI
jgi:glycosyltransferase involved in cell wall biosynthesis